MGIFTEADQHPFDEQDRAASSEESRGGSSDRMSDEHRMRDFIRPTERARGLYIRDDSPAALLS